MSLSGLYANLRQLLARTSHGRDTLDILKVLGSPPTYKDAPRYIEGIEIYEGFARLHPDNCAVKERTGDGVPVGACQFYLPDGKTCPRHGKVKE